MNIPATNEVPMVPAMSVHYVRILAGFPQILITFSLVTSPYHFKTMNTSMTTPIKRTIRKTTIGSTDSFFSSIEITRLSDPNHTDIDGIPSQLYYYRSGRYRHPGPERVTFL